MKKKFLVVALMALCTMMIFAACSSAPSYLKNPPADPASLITKLTEDGYDASQKASTMTFKVKKEDKTFNTVIVEGDKFASGITREEFALLTEEEKKSDTKKVVFEYVSVYYCDSNSDAKAVNGNVKTFWDAMNEVKPKGVKFDYSVSQKNKTVSVYVKVSGKLKDISSGINFRDVENPNYPN